MLVVVPKYRKDSIVNFINCYPCRRVPTIVDRRPLLENGAVMVNAPLCRNSRAWSKATTLISIMYARSSGRRSLCSWSSRSLPLPFGTLKMAASHLLFFTLFSSTLASCVPRTTVSTQPQSNTTVTCSTFGGNATRPVVDLSYALHAPQIVSSLDSRTYYNFSNIRYAAPPVDSLRFHLPEDPINNRSAGVQDGTYGKICPQAYTPWQSTAAVQAPPGVAESEDCLFLDVVVPQDVWSQRCNTSRPVIVWIHGGGFQIGSKWGTPMTNPLGLLDRSFDDDGEGAIWVGIQYRVSGPPTH